MGKLERCLIATFFFSSITLVLLTVAFIILLPCPCYTFRRQLPGKKEIVYMRDVEMNLKDKW